MSTGTEVMGIVNLTDDSYFPESRCLGSDGKTDTDKAIERTRRLIADGADIIDVGACSTRPGSKGVGAEEEWKRLRPFLEVFKKEFPGQRLSIDTYHASVVERAYGTVGPFMVNDISAGHADADMLPTVGRTGLKYIAMHMRGMPENMQTLTSYPEGIVAAVRLYFEDFAAEAERNGVDDWVLDPGFGFAKTVEQNYELLARLGELSALGRPILVGVSRKSMIYKLFNITPEESLPATEVLHFKALQQGAGILRVHDVAEARRCIQIFQKLG